jgi:hypothetical protein
MSPRQWHKKFHLRLRCWIFWRELQGPSDGVNAGKDISQIIANFGYDEIRSDDTDFLLQCRLGLHVFIELKRVTVAGCDIVARIFLGGTQNLRLIRLA